MPLGKSITNKRTKKAMRAASKIKTSLNLNNKKIGFFNTDFLMIKLFFFLSRLVTDSMIHISCYQA